MGFVLDDNSMTPCSVVVLPALRSAAVVLERTVESAVADFEAGMIVTCGFVAMCQ